MTSPQQQLRDFLTSLRNSGMPTLIGTLLAGMPDEEEIVGAPVYDAKQPLPSSQSWYLGFEEPDWDVDTPAEIKAKSRRFADEWAVVHEALHRYGAAVLERLEAAHDHADFRSEYRFDGNMQPPKGNTQEDQND